MDCRNLTKEEMIYILSEFYAIQKIEDEDISDMFSMVLYRHKGIENFTIKELTNELEGIDLKIYNQMHKRWEDEHDYYDEDIVASLKQKKIIV